MPLLSKRPMREKYRSFYDSDIAKLTEADLPALRANAEECVAHNIEVWHEYSARAQAIYTAIEALFPTDKFSAGKPKLHKLMQQAEKAVSEESPFKYGKPSMETYNEWEKRLRQKWKDAALEKARAAHKESQQRQRNENDVKAIRWAAVRGWMDVSDVDGFIKKACETDKYLNLAMAMERTRNDWSEGFYRVKRSLRGFEIESPQDQEIYDDVASCMDAEDGRVFRDTDWNYSRIYELADADLLKQISELEMSK